MDNKFENHVKSDKVKWVVVFGKYRRAVRRIRNRDGSGNVRHGL